MEIIVRKAELRDIDTMLQLLEHLLSLEGDYPMDVEKQKVGIRMIIESSFSDFFVADLGGKLCGMCCLHRFISSVQGGYVGVVEDVVVSKECKGLGIGSRMMEYLEKYSSEIGLTRLQLQVDKDNAPAISMYKKHGWTQTKYVGFRKYI